MGVLGWPPAQFWQATPHDLYAALDGWNQVQGGERGLDDEDKAELYELLQQGLKDDHDRNNS